MSPVSEQSKPLIFVVDDEPLLLELALALLEPSSYQVETFRDAESALKAFAVADPHPELIITDYSMHEMTGMDFIKECRKLRPEQKVLMTSGTVDEGIYRNSPVKPDRFLAKPYQPRKFVGIVEGLLRN